tara:strand:+ start:117 stop:329 length:213 start_codon:yes stop_codon:yes gene_type:complete
VHDEFNSERFDELCIEMAFEIGSMMMVARDELDDMEVVELVDEVEKMEEVFLRKRISCATAASNGTGMIA